MNGWTLSELSGKVGLIVELDGTEGLPDTCKSALEELGLRGFVPPGVAITNLSASRATSDSATVRCSIDWDGSVEGHSHLTMPSRPIGDPWTDVWLEYRRIFDRLKMTEAEAWQLVAWALRVASKLGVATDADGIADALKEFVVLCGDRRPGANVRDELAASVMRLSAATDVLRPHLAVRLFGTPGGKLHAVLAELDVRNRDT